MPRAAPNDISAFGDVFEPKEAAEPILAKAVRGGLLEWITEIFAEDDLRAVGIAARRRALFSGPSGSGKTTLAHHLAARLGLRMLAVRPDRVVSQWVNETARNIGDLFVMVASLDEPIVLFFDEFDALAAERRTARQHAEREDNANVDVLLQRVEQHDGFLIAATNHPDAIDPAIWRRFDLHMTIDLPGQFERERILARYLAPFGLPKDDLGRLATALALASPALIRQFCEALKRQFVLGDRLGWDMRKAATIDRILASVGPHPDAGKPRLWSHGSADIAINFMPWPLPRADEITDDSPAAAAAPQGAVVSFPKRAEG